MQQEIDRFNACALTVKKQVKQKKSKEKVGAQAEVLFLGLFLSDGNLNKKNNAITIVQSERYQQVCAEIEKCLSDCGFRHGKCIRKQMSLVI